MSAKTLRHIKSDMELLLPNHQLRTIFDVGANVGQTLAPLRALYPEAELYAFEPVASTYSELTKVADGMENARAFNVGLGDTDGAAPMTAKAGSVNNHVVPSAGRGTKDVAIVRGDSFCESHSIERISYLKVDTEGYEIPVLAGFQKTLSDDCIDVIELEAGMNWENVKHTPLERLRGFLEPMGYRVFRFYEQIAEKRGAPQLRRVNVLFISQTMIAGNVRPPKANPAPEKKRPARLRALGSGASR